MPRLSLWRPNKGNDYKFFDQRISEMFTVGGVDVYLHKYLGPIDQTFTSNTEPGTTGLTSIQDLLFLENRDRKYDTSVYTMRTIYRINDNDFDLQQFGLFLTGDTMFAVFHLNDMIDTIGRKIMVGDVLELPNLKDYYPLDDTLTAALKRYYVVQDATRAAEGFAPTWYPHLWRVKLQPLVDSQEYKDILDNIAAGDTNGDGVVDAEEHRMYLEFKRKRLEDEDAMRDAQRQMTWFALFGMLLYPFAVVLAQLVGLDGASKILGDMAATYFVSVAAIVMAFFGKTAYESKNNTDK